MTQNYESSGYALNERWTHIAVTWYPEKQMVIYIDGCVHEEIAPIPGQHPYRVRNTVIGKSANGNNRYASGVIDEFNFWEQKLDAAEIMAVSLKWVTYDRLHVEKWDLN